MSRVTSEQLLKFVEENSTPTHDDDGSRVPPLLKGSDLSRSLDVVATLAKTELEAEQTELQRVFASAEHDKDLDAAAAARAGAPTHGNYN